MDEEARLQLQSIIERLTPEDRITIANLPQEQVILLHRGLGSVIRNRIRANEFGALARWAKAQIGDEKLSFDALSWPILLRVWETVR